MTIQVLGLLALFFSIGLLLQLLACVLYNNWWPMLSALMYVLLPMPLLFFGGGDSMDFIRVGDDGSEWQDCAQFLTGFSLVGSVAIPAMLRHAGFIALGAMWLDLAAFAVLLLTLGTFIRVNMEPEW